MNILASYYFLLNGEFEREKVGVILCVDLSRFPRGRSERDVNFSGNIVNFKHPICELQRFICELPRIGSELQHAASISL